MTYVVEVETSTHDDLKDGVLALPRGLTGSRYRGQPNESGITRGHHVGGPRFTTVVLSAREVASDAEAVCLAAQIAACTSGDMPTRTTLVSWPTKGSTMKCPECGVAEGEPCKPDCKCLDCRWGNGV
jgi:hypothetical protein